MQKVPNITIIFAHTPTWFFYDYIYKQSDLSF